MSRPILIVDDDALQVETLGAILRWHGWEVREASSGEEAIAVAAEAGQPLVLMDVKMPGMNGVTALKAMKARWPQIQVMLMTAYSSPEVIADAKREGAINVVQKPIDIASLLEVLDTQVKN